MGYLDDLVLLPAGIILALKLIPSQVIDECRQTALTNRSSPGRKSWLGAAVIILIWLLLLTAIAIKISSRL